ncbi:uncharacterized protein [Diabrotica undecimpunctata]|uniref:uncharacterized protein n=1 Tax=Diabrotica undecimpunctata TaxID=50387 RepID=UPI003B632D09
MKYLYYIYFFCTISYYYVSAKDVLLGTDACECLDCLKPILDQIHNSNTTINNIENLIQILRQDIKNIKGILDVNCEKIDGVEGDLDELDAIINVNLELVNQENLIIHDIDVKVKELNLEGEELDEMIDGNNCTLNDIQTTVNELQSCACAVVTTASGSGTQSTTPYYFHH